MPDEGAIVALLPELVHVPPAGVPVSVAVPPTHTDSGPEMTGDANTVSGLIAIQPDVPVYVIEADPAVTAVTTPVAVPTVIPPVPLHAPPAGVAVTV